MEARAVVGAKLTCEDELVCPTELLPPARTLASRVMAWKEAGINFSESSVSHLIF